MDQHPQAPSAQMLELSRSQPLHCYMQLQGTALRPVSHKHHCLTVANYVQKAALGRLHSQADGVCDIHPATAPAAMLGNRPGRASNKHPALHSAIVVQEFDASPDQSIL